ncbi:uncharacterized protein IL334_000639 [Kwoniella shivajii]|uniref:BTB domain-containing protein n=1 Tax=Kwoniella shivajii TaxID=564305 RepID=A0ABZ1CPQ3_9TREE|nr:hypothetical protein IL334_000639 [Kwoniella shivajii]
MSDQSSDGGSEKNEISVDLDLKCHPVHNDPNDDIVIISNDYVKFRASRYHLTRTSQFFDGLLGNPRPEDLASVCDPFIPIITIPRAQSLVTYTDFAICDILVDKARYALMEAAKDQPLELLVIASKRDDVEMARAALKELDTDHLRTYLYESQSLIATESSLTKSRTYISRLTLAYRLELLDLLMETGEVSEGRRETLRTGIFLKDSWSGIASKFDPKRIEKEVVLEKQKVSDIAH